MKIEVDEQKLIMLKREYNNLQEYVFLRPIHEERYKILCKIFEEVILEKILVGGKQR